MPTAAERNEDEQTRCHENCIVVIFRNTLKQRQHESDGARAWGARGGFRGSGRSQRTTKRKPNWRAWAAADQRSLDFDMRLSGQQERETEREYAQLCRVQSVKGEQLEERQRSGDCCCCCSPHCACISEHQVKMSSCCRSLALALSLSLFQYLSALGRLRRFSTLVGFAGRQANSNAHSISSARPRPSTSHLTFFFFISVSSAHEGCDSALHKHTDTVFTHTHTHTEPFITFESRHYKNTKREQSVDDDIIIHPAATTSIPTPANVVKQARVFVVVAAPRNPQTDKHTHAHFYCTHTRILRPSTIGSNQLFRPTVASLLTDSPILPPCPLTVRFFVIVLSFVPDVATLAAAATATATNINIQGQRQHGDGVCVDIPTFQFWLEIRAPPLLARGNCSAQLWTVYWVIFNSVFNLFTLLQLLLDSAFLQ